MKVVFLAAIVVTVCGTACSAAALEPDENCDWQYKCCDREPRNGACKTLCPTPTIVCPTAEEHGDGGNGIAKFSALKVIVSVPCKEGYRRDHTKRCRKIFEEPLYY
uniref:Uncharacterized protein n=1 Tax=Anopheles dirus TaxID=7168 RepID=A0A182NGC5_9DIPT